MLHICAITATCGRHTCMERSMRFFLDQDYDGPHTHLIYNNASIAQEIGITERTSENKQTLLINRDTSIETGKSYRNLGEIYRDALKYVPENVDVITFWDDDDIFLPYHLRFGVNGINEAISKGYIAYKPAESYFRSTERIVRTQNTLEPSIFVLKDHVEKHGFSDTTTEQHLQWVKPLAEKNLIYVKPNGEPTLIYNWGDGEKIPTFKTSGDFTNPNNFMNYREWSRDHGDRILTPISKELGSSYYRIS